MHHTSTLRSVLLATIALTSFASPTSALTIAEWTFELDDPGDPTGFWTSVSPLFAPETGAGVLEAWVGAAIASQGAVSVSNLNSPLRSPDDDTESLNVGISDGFRSGFIDVQVSTLGLSGIQLTADLQRSGNPSLYAWGLAWSLDDVTYTGAAGSLIWNQGWNQGFWDLSAITALDNQPVVYLTLSTSQPGGSPTSGNVDNVLVTAGGVPEPSLLSLLSVAFVGLGRRQRRRAITTASPRSECAA